MTPRVSPILAILGLMWVVVVAGLAVLKPAAFALSTVTAVLQFSTILALVALGQALVIVCGGAGIDISVGGMVSLAVVLAMLLVNAGLPGASLPVLCLALGLALGLVNGFLVTRLKLLPLIATLGTFYVYSGTAVALTGGAAQAGVPGFLLPWGRGAVGGLPLPFLTLALPLFVAAGVLLHATSWGRWIYGMGFNERSARLVGIPVDRVRLAAYGASGTLAGCAALVSLAWLGGGRPNIGQNLELTSLTATMLGGIGIFGGKGGVFGLGETREQMAESQANGVKPQGGAGFAYLSGPDHALIEVAGNNDQERFNHIHMWEGEPFCAQLWYQTHLNAKVSARPGAPVYTKANCHVPRGVLTWPSLTKGGMYRSPTAGVQFSDVGMMWYMDQTDKPLVATRGHLMDSVGLGVSDLDAWVAKLKAENVTFLRQPFKIGDTRAVMIEGPSHEALELVEVK